MMIVMIRTRNQSFFLNWFNFRKCIFKISGQFHTNYHRFLLGPDVCVSTYCDEKKYLKQLIDVSKVDQNDNKERSKEFNEEEKISEKASSSIKKIDFLKKLRAYEIPEEEKNVSVKKAPSGNENTDLLQLLRTYESPEKPKDTSETRVAETEDGSQILKKLRDIENIIETKQRPKQNPVVAKLVSNLLNKIEVEKKIANKVKKKWKLLSDPKILQKALNDALEFAVENKESLSLQDVYSLMDLIYKNSKIWSNSEKMEFMASKEFRDLQKIFLNYIEIIPAGVLISQVLPLFSKYLQLSSDDIIFYTIFKKMDDECKNLKYYEKIELIYKCNNYFKESEMVSDLQEKLLSELNNSHHVRQINCFMPSEDLLDWSTFDSIADDVKIIALEKFLVLPNRRRKVDNFSKYFQVFYSLSDDYRKKFAHLEEKGIKEVETFLLKDWRNRNAVVGIIFCYGRAVKQGKITVNQEFLDNVLNWIMKNKTLPIKSLHSVIAGVRKARYVNYKFLEYLEEYLINNFESVLKESFTCVIILNTLADYDFLTKSKNWPYLKNLLESVNVYGNVFSEKSLMTQQQHSNRIYTPFTYALRIANLLLYTGVYPEKLLNQISILSSTKRAIMAMSIEQISSLLKIHQSVYYLFNENKRFLSEEMANYVREQTRDISDKVPQNVAVREKRKNLKVRVEEAVGIKDSVTETCLLKEGIKAHQLMVFNYENEPYCLRNFLENNAHLEDIDFPEESKKVVVRFESPVQFFKDSNGNRFLAYHQVHRINIFKKLGFKVVIIEDEIWESLPDEMVGIYIYDQIKKAIASSSV